MSEPSTSHLVLYADTDDTASGAHVSAQSPPYDRIEEERPDAYATLDDLRLGGITGRSSRRSAAYGGAGMHRRCPA